MSSGRSAIETGQILSQSEGNGLYIWNGTAPGGSFTINGLNQALTFGASSLTYDGRGNMTSDGTATYAYDIANRLTGKTGGPTLTYDPAGRLAQVAGGATTRFAYDGGRIVAEYDGSGAMLRRYVPGAGVDETLVWYEGSGTLDRRYLFTDERGSVIAITNATGASIGTNTYDEYGRPGALNVGRFQYTGQAYIPELGLYYYKARFYSPELKRFLQPDPIGYAGGMNLYGYVGGDPVNASDPSGKDSQMVDCKLVRCGSEPTSYSPFSFAVRQTTKWLSISSVSCIRGVCEPLDGTYNSGITRRTTTIVINYGYLNGSGGRALGGRSLGGSRLENASAIGAGIATLIGLAIDYLFGESDDEGSTEIFRVVSAAELASILQTQQYMLAPGMMEVKLFWLSPDDADWFASSPLSGPDLTLVSSRVFNSTLALGEFSADAGHKFVSFDGAALVSVNNDASRTGGISIRKVYP